MHYTANVIIKLQHFSGDVSGNLTGNFGVYISETSMTPIGNISVQSRVASGVDPITSLHKALSARADMPVMTEQEDAPRVSPTLPMYPTAPVPTAP